ncbi:hypothetical protein K1719_001927 [Acacia pycnantha]|nr:hypothetical protein K1719_001927 [Acacia pycnantha]
MASLHYFIFIAKCYRAYCYQLTKDTEDGDVAEKIGIYQAANKQVAIICTEDPRALVNFMDDLDRAKKGKPPLKSAERKRNLTRDALEKKIAQTNAKIEKMRRDMKTKEDFKTVALGTSKINYLDPKITVVWCGASGMRFLLKRCCLLHSFG